MFLFCPMEGNDSFIQWYLSPPRNNLINHGNLDSLWKPGELGGCKDTQYLGGSEEEQRAPFQGEERGYNFDLCPVRNTVLQGEG